ncbi:MAG: DUF2520 domain-containing protein [Flavobacteriales bacterium]|nr:DUF2520 domain-containing protein [Flavobacteriales bacterium]
MTSILLIGTGRMAYHLGHAIMKAKLPLIGVAGRNPEKLNDLARFLECPAHRLDRALPEADLVIIATSDDSIAEIAARIPAGGTVVAHTAGAVPIDVLVPHEHRAVIWPVQTLSHGAPIDLSDVPLAVEASSPEAEAVILKLARAVSGSVLQLPHRQRELLHLTAVLASNFPVFLMHEAQRLLKQEKLPPNLLMPLWKLTAQKVTTIGPAEALTGPARRGDITSVKRHLELLEGEADLRRAYAQLSSMVLKAHGHPTDGIDL